jgi:hypothetical protein
MDDDVAEAPDVSPRNLAVACTKFLGQMCHRFTYYGQLVDDGASERDSLRTIPGLGRA